MTDTAKTPAEIGAARLSAATAEVPADDAEKLDPKVASRFVWKKGDMTITNRDGTVVT